MSVEDLPMPLPLSALELELPLVTVRWIKAATLPFSFAALELELEVPLPTACSIKVPALLLSFVAFVAGGVHLGEGLFRIVWEALENEDLVVGRGEAAVRPVGSCEWRRTCYV